MNAKHARYLDGKDSQTGRGIKSLFEDLRDDQMALPEDAGKGLLARDISGQEEQAQSDKELAAEKQQFLRALEANPALMITTTGTAIEGHAVRAYKGTISCDGVVGTSVVATADALLSDVAGDRSMLLARKVEEAKQIAWAELLFRAHKRGANALVGVRYDVYILYKNMIGASVTATAVVVD